MYPSTFKENMPTGLGFEWLNINDRLSKVLMTNQKVSLESLQWLEWVQQNDPRLIDRNGIRIRIHSAWLGSEKQFGKYYFLDPNFSVF